MADKVVKNVSDAIVDCKDGMTLMVGGFGLNGVAENLLAALVEKGVKDIDLITCNVGVDDWATGVLLKAKLVRSVLGSYVGENKTFETQYLDGDISVTLVPMGSFCERIRAAGAGIPGFYSPAGVGTPYHYGTVPSKYNKDGSPLEFNEMKECRIFNGRPYLFETALPSDVSFVKAWKGDRYGNLVFKGSSNNFNTCMAMAGKYTIAEVEELVEPGEIDPKQVHLPGIFVHKIVHPSKFEKRIERKVFSVAKKTEKSGADDKKEEKPVGRARIPRRTALEFNKNGMYANLGIGLPTSSLNFLPKDMTVHLHSENGILGMGDFPEEGKEDADWTNASKQTVTPAPGASTFDGPTSFAMIRGGHCDLTVLGGLQVSQYGDLANWLIPGKKVNGMGGAMDLVSAGSRVVVTMEHVARDGSGKILPSCSLPLTGRNCVSRIITDMAVFDVCCKDGLTLIEIADDVTVEKLKELTPAPFKVSPDLCPMRFA